MVEHNTTTPPPIGIDLGTSNSAVGVWNPATSAVEIVPNEIGQNTTPSVVSFSPAVRGQTGPKVLVGAEAENQAINNADNTISGSKRVLGHQKQLEAIQILDGKDPNKLVQGADGSAEYEVTIDGEKKNIKPEQVSSMILTKMRETSEAHTKTSPIRDAVITVPAYFNDSQREATKQAGQIAHLNVLRIINEPTAAAIAYGLEQANNTCETCFIFDFGGGTLDCTLLNIDKNMDEAEFKVVATKGDCHLGGEDFDDTLVAYCAAEFEKTTKQDITKSAKSLRKLKRACEQAKKELSSAMTTMIEINALTAGNDFEMEISRDKFNEICDPLIQKMVPIVTGLLEDAKMSPDQIDQIVLVGGTSRIPKVQEILQGLFNGKELNHKINPDEAVAYGATLLAAQLTGYVQKVKLKDVIPLDLGIEVELGEEDHRMSLMINKNTEVPCRFEKHYSTVMANQPAINFRILQGAEGEGSRAEECTELGKATLSNIDPAPAGEPDIIVTFSVDENGILTMNCRDADTLNNAEYQVTCTKGKLSEEDVHKIIDDAENLKEDNEKEQQRLQSQNAFETFVFSLKKIQQDEEQKSKLNETDISTLDVCIGLCDEFLTEATEEGVAIERSAADYEVKMQEIREFSNTVMDRLEGKEAGPMIKTNEAGPMEK